MRRDGYMKPFSKRISIIVLSVLIVLTLCFIFGNSLKGPDASKEQSDSVGEVLRPIIDPDKSMPDDEYSFFVRKSGHFVEYALLGIECALLAFTVCGRPTLTGAVYSAGGSLFAANVDEFIQSFTGRGSRVADVLLDFGGAITGIALGFAAVCAVRYIYRKKKETHQTSDR